MTIKFLRDHRGDAIPVETFTAGQVVEGRSPESELHFVRRGIAAFFDEKAKSLTDHEGRPVEEKPSEAVLLTVADNRDGGPGRAGEVELGDGTPQRASSGPGEVVTTSAVTEGKAVPAPRRKPAK